ncbi:diacylglycerol kinase family protein [Kitasatospora kazusensis]|uniref:Diacylglycerol kinase family protein n=1 Tax=Kitasatospora kazusensis TaxID=407974 RepID=A0ABP5KZ78_9ACTN
MSSLSTPEYRAVSPGGPDPLLVLLDPAARRADGESVRIARDVLCGGADAKVALPESMTELDRVLAHRGRRRPVVIGADLAVRRVLQALHRQRELGADPVGVVPVGRPGAVGALRALGVPAEPVVAARAVINGSSRKLDLLVDDCGAVVLGGVRIRGAGDGHPGGWRSLWAKLASSEQGKADHRAADGAPDPRRRLDPRLRIEADGQLLADVHQPVRLLQVNAPADGGVMELVLRLSGGVRRQHAASLTVAGREFGYEADGRPVGPVRSRTWTVHAGAWELMLPSG